MPEAAVRVEAAAAAALACDVLLHPDLLLLRLLLLLLPEGLPLLPLRLLVQPG
jgi:hypothetical protein